MEGILHTKNQTSSIRQDISIELRLRQTQTPGRPEAATAALAYGVARVKRAKRRMTSESLPWCHGNY